MAQFVERLLPIVEVCSSNPDISKIYIEHLLPNVMKRRNKEKEARNGPFKKTNYSSYWAHSIRVLYFSVAQLHKAKICLLHRLVSTQMPFTNSGLFGTCLCIKGHVVKITLKIAKRKLHDAFAMQHKFFNKNIQFVHHL